MTTDLIGVWSANALFASPGQEDEIVVFRSDGTGWIEWMNFGAHRIEFFWWEPTSPGWFALSSQGCFERDPHNLKRYIHTERDINDLWDHLPISVKEVNTPHGSVIQLEMELTDWNGGLYGLIQKDADLWSRPQTPS